MKIAYIIIAHKLPGQLVRLVKLLNTESVSFFIHVDKKTDDKTFLQMKEPLHAWKNVHFLKRRVANWGTFGQVQATLDGIQQALDLAPAFDYVILLTGQDYPIKSNEYISKFLEDGNGKSYLEYFSLPDDIWKNENGGLDRINFWNLYFLGRPRKVFPRFDLPYRKFLRENRIFGGSAYWCLTRDCAKYINEYWRHNDHVRKFWKYVRIPDELFFQTALINSPFTDKIINDNFRYIVWRTTPHPEILSTQDYEQLLGSKNLFARKFDANVDSKVLDLIDLAIS
jgi:hypothetical protein